ncbi:hypothetical protein [Acetobacter nitrogenifigens]|nr:hypothetical protein [Acetobacter nitrogenifigens]
MPAAVAEGASHRAAAARFGVGATSVSYWGLGGDRRSSRIEARHGLICRLLAHTPDITTTELRVALPDRDHSFGHGTLLPFFALHRLTRKKDRARQRADRPAILSQRQARLDGQIDLDPERLVVIDETWAKTNMARTHGLCARGQRLRMGVPFGHWRTALL